MNELTAICELPSVDGLTFERLRDCMSYGQAFGLNPTEWVVIAVAALLGMPEPDVEGRAAFARVIVESIADAFARTLRTAGELAGREIDVVNLVGGGALNALLCQATADRSGLPVLAGPVEATALGNVLVQARALGCFGADASLEDLRVRVASVFPAVRFDPRS